MLLQDTQWTQTSSTWYTKRLTVIPGPSKRPCSSEYRTLPSTGILGITSYHTYGTTYFRCHPPYSASLQTTPLHPHPHNPLLVPLFPLPILLPLSIIVGAHTFLYGKYTSVLNTPPIPLIPPTPNLQQVLNQHHLGKFLTFYLLG